MYRLRLRKAFPRRLRHGYYENHRRTQRSFRRSCGPKQIPSRQLPFQVLFSTQLTFDNCLRVLHTRQNEQMQSQRLPALDGVRGVAILLVVVGHSLRNEVAAMVVGRFGVVVFFVLSGYLITRLLLISESQDGNIDLKRFYVRRALRIFPAFYAFLIVIASLVALGLTPHLPERTWLACALYFRNYVADDWSSTSHLWSLSLEEQFYLLWPTFLLITRRHRPWAVGLALLTLTAYRAVWIYTHSHVGIESNLHPEFYMNTLLIGAVFAIFRPAWLLSVPLMPVCLLLSVWWVAALSPWARPLHGSVAALLIGFLISRCADHHSRSVGTHLLSQPALRFAGTLSYSLYLWQQLFLGPNLRWWSFPALALVACTSYFLIERPFLRLKDRSNIRARSQESCAIEVAAQST